MSRKRRILQVSVTDVDGGRFNGYYIHKYLSRNNYISDMVVSIKRSKDPKVHQIFLGSRYINYGIRMFEKLLSIHSFLYPAPILLLFKKYFRKTDLIHLHLIQNNWFSILMLPIISRIKPTVLTLHNPWDMTGHCIHPIECERWKTGCGKCPHLKRQWSLLIDTSSFLWKVKRYIFSKSNITLVVASGWMRQHMKNSPILSHLPCHLIPFGLDINIYKPLDKKTSKKRLGISEQAIVLCFRNPKRKEGFKGMPWLIEALKQLNTNNKEVYLLILESDRNLNCLKDKYKIKTMNWLKKDKDVVTALNAADIFIMPSIAESFGMMAIEAMACGTPVITTNSTPTANLVEAPKGGLAVPPKNSKALMDAINKLIFNEELRKKMSVQGRKIVEEKYSFDRYIKEHLILYEKIINTFKK